VPDPSASKPTRRGSLRLSPESLRLIAELADALSAPRNQSRFKVPGDTVPLVTANGDPVGFLVWCGDDCGYRFAEATP
jgi:hypothetical protein